VSKTYRASRQSVQELLLSEGTLQKGCNRQQDAGYLHCIRWSSGTVVTLDSLRNPRMFQVVRGKREVLSNNSKPRSTPSRDMKQNILHRMDGREGWYVLRTAREPESFHHAVLRVDHLVSNN
jgi:hypothetical protein